jgi:hypothetical protein
MIKRMAGQLVLDAKLDTVAGLARTGELPEHRAERLCEHSRPSRRRS